MELKERLKEILKTKYGIDSEDDLMRAIEEQPEVDFGIFVTPKRGDIKSA